MTVNESRSGTPPERPHLEGATLRPSGEAAIVVEYGDRIDWTFQSKGLALAEALATVRPAGLIEVVPTYRSVLIEFDPDETDPDALLAALPERIDRSGADAGAATREWVVPVCVADDMAEDAAQAAAVLGLSREEAVRRLLQSVMRVGMYGFAPGFAYLKGLDPALELPRRATPRPPMPAGSIIIANGQAAIAPRPMPTGWYVMGRTPIRMFDPTRPGPGMVPFAIGDRLYLREVDRSEFDRLVASESGGLSRYEGGT